MLRASVLHFKSRASKNYGASNKGTLDVKCHGLDFTLLLNPALEFSALPWQTEVCRPRNATTKMAVLLIARVRSLNLRADCHRPEPSTGFVLDLRAGAGNQQYI
jgi:hypothetical protein